MWPFGFIRSCFCIGFEARSLRLWSASVMADDARRVDKDVIYQRDLHSRCRAIRFPLLEFVLETIVGYH